MPTKTTTIPDIDHMWDTKWARDFEPDFDILYCQYYVAYIVVVGSTPVHYIKGKKNSQLQITVKQLICHWMVKKLR